MDFISTFYNIITRPEYMFGFGAVAGGLITNEIWRQVIRWGIKQFEKENGLR